MKTDVLIVGSGCSGLYCALSLPQDLNVTVITKSEVEKSDSFLAQGGMCMLADESDYQNFFEDTLKAGHYENDKTSVEIMIRSSKEVVEDLVKFGAEFKRNPDGTLCFTKEGAHSKPRIIFHEDITGKEITTALLNEALKRKNIKILEHTTLLDIIEKDNTCFGAVISTADGKIQKVECDFTVLATGGVGGVYEHSTNYRHLTGDALAIAMKHKIKLRDVSYVQIHPTTFYSDDQRSFLISESVRGEGAILRDKNGERFVNELLPRDVVTKAIQQQMKKDNTQFVWEDLTVIPEKDLREHFPNIVAFCLEKGYDVTKEWIPVVPAQHYYMGGISVDYQSKTSMNGLYAVGETACNGVHGKNRLASNSLLESLVFAKRAAFDIAKPQEILKDNDFIKNYSTEYLVDIDELLKEYYLLVKNELQREPVKMFDEATLKLNVDPLILSALREDITSEDVSANAVMRENQDGEAELICKEDGVICGLQVFERVFTLLDSNVKVEKYVTDGDEVKKGQIMARVRGEIRTLLCGERTALNYLQRMSGIATYTRAVAKLLEGSKTTLLDTRKTTPNNRIFEKYSVRIGGGKNHRYNLSDGVLLKDNHIGAAGSVAKAIALAKEYAPFVRKIEVEVETLDMVREAVLAGADIIMLDNMTTEVLKEAIAIIDGKAEIEVSGNVTKENIDRLISLGVDFISSGALTHSAPILDISLKNLHTV